MAPNELLNAWLKDAYSMEMGMIYTLDNHAYDAIDYPSVQARHEQHIRETRCHAELVNMCIERRGDYVSTLKTAVDGMVGAMQSVMPGPFEDEVVKNVLWDYAAETFEVATYQALIVAAQALDDQDTARVCQQIMQEDWAMAQWLEQNLPMIVKQALREKATEHSPA